MAAQNGFHMIVTDCAAWLMKASPSLQYYPRFINCSSKLDVAAEEINLWPR